MNIAIVGGAPSSEHLAPFDDPEWEIWVLGNQLDHHKGRRVTRIFELHHDLSEHDNQYAQWLVEQNIPLIVSDNFPIKAEHVKRYPRNDIALKDYLTSSAAYMMGLAILEGAEHIGIYGIDMAVDDHEYFMQSPCMNAWIGYAKGKGIEITIPDESPLFKSTYDEGIDYRYAGPFEQNEFLTLANEHQKCMDEIETQITELRYKLNAHSGAKQVYERLAKVSRAVDSGQNIKSLLDTVVIK